MSQFDGQLAGWFCYHPPVNPQVGVAHDEIRRLFLELATQLDVILPDGPASPATNVYRSVVAEQDKRAAFLKLREAMYAANASLACNATDTYPDEG